MADKRSTSLLAILGYAVAFVGMFIVFAYISFPYDRLRDFIVAKVNSQSGGRDGRAELSIGELSPAPLLGLSLERVVYRTYDGKDSDEPSVLAVDELDVRTSLWSLLFGSRKVFFDAVIGAGTLEGMVAQDEDGLEVEADLEALDLKQVGLGNYLSFPIEGVAAGSVELSLPNDAAKSEGSVQLSVERLALGDGEGQVKVPGMREGFTVERIDAGTLELATHIDGGRANIEAFQANGPDLTLKGDGDIKLMTPLARSRLNLALEFKFSEGYKTRDDKTKALFELMSFRPELKRATTPDGALRFQLRGFLASPRGIPAGKR